MNPIHAPRPHPDRPNPTPRIVRVTCAAAITAMLAACAPEPVQESLLIEFTRDDESEVRMEIRAEVKLNRDAADEGDEAVHKQIDQIVAELAGGTGPWHARFDRLRNPTSDGIDLREDKGELSRFQRWAVMTDPGPALVDFFADTKIVPTYEVAPGSQREAGQESAPRTATLTFRPADESPATADANCSRLRTPLSGFRPQSTRRGHTWRRTRRSAVAGSVFSPSATRRSWMNSKRTSPRTRKNS